MSILKIQHPNFIQMGALSFDQVSDLLRSKEIDEETKIQVIKTGAVFPAGELESRKSSLPKSSKTTSSYVGLSLAVILLVPPAFTIAFPIAMGASIADLKPAGWVIAIIPLITSLILFSNFFKRHV